jgi:hypothetical protein
MSYSRLLVVLGSLWAGLAIALLTTYSEWKEVADIILTVTAVASFLMSLYDFLSRRR